VKPDPNGPFSLDTCSGMLTRPPPTAFTGVSISASRAKGFRLTILGTCECNDAWTLNGRSEDPVGENLGVEFLKQTMSRGPSAERRNKPEACQDRDELEFQPSKPFLREEPFSSILKDDVCLLKVQ
jgi:hypothetical protein